jgi:hypothetical protein
MLTATWGYSEVDGIIYHCLFIIVYLSLFIYYCLSIIVYLLLFINHHYCGGGWVDSMTRVPSAKAGPRAMAF